MINCFRVSGHFKEKGYGKAFCQECIADSKDKKGLVVIMENKKNTLSGRQEIFRETGF